METASINDLEKHSFSLWQCLAASSDKTKRKNIGWKLLLLYPLYYLDLISANCVETSATIEENNCKTRHIFT